MAAKSLPRPRRRRCARCDICNAWRPITELKTDSGIAHAGAPDSTFLMRFWECRTHTPKQEERFNSRSKLRRGIPFVGEEIA